MKNQHSSPVFCEALESRRLMAIVWTNRQNNTFDTVFGTNANAARNVIDAAIADWNSIILNFNHAGGGNNYNISFTVMDLGGGLRAQGGATTHDGERVPNAGSITLDNNAGGSGWYLDATPLDDSEFTTVNAPFSANGSVSGNDLYRTAAHEIGHCVGIDDDPALLLSDFLTDLGVDDPNTADPGNLLGYNIGGSLLEGTFTAADAGHLYEGPAIAGRPDIPIHPRSLMNPGRAAADNERKLIGDIEATILNAVYGYDIAMPSQVNNMYVNPNFTNDVLSINGLDGANNDTFVVQGDFNPNILNVTANGFVEPVPLGEVGTIVVNGGVGSDLFRLEYAANRFTTYNGGAGVDTLDLAFVTHNLSNIGGPTLFNGGPDVDYMHLYDNSNNSLDPFSIDEDSITRFGTGIQQYDSAVENVYLTTGSNHNAVNISRTSSLTKLFLNSAGGQDLVNIGPSQFFINGPIEVENDPSFTTINIDDTGNTSPQNADIDLAGQFGWISGLNATISWDNADVKEIRVTTGSGNDSIDVFKCSERLFLDNTGGRDNITLGNISNGMQAITGEIDIEPSPSGVFTDLIMNDAASSIPRAVAWNSVGFDMLVTGMALVAIRYDESAVDTFTMFGGLSNDTFTLIGDPSVTTSVSINGGGGTGDSITLDDRNYPSGDIGTAFVYADGVVRFWDFTPQSNLFYDNCEQMIWHLPQNQINDVVVHGIASDFTVDFQIRGNVFSELVNLYPHLTTPSINGNLFIIGSGGADVVSVVDDANSPGGTYTLSNLLSPTFAHLTGIGSGYAAVSGDVENLAIQGSDANDNFVVNQFKSGSALAMNGGGGNDTCTIGNGDMSGNLTNASAFSFDGGLGSDRFTIANGATNSPWIYQVQDGFTNLSRLSNGYFWNSVTPGTESTYVVAGSSGDGFYVDSLASGNYVELNGFGGIDGLSLGVAADSLANIRGHISYNPGTDGGNMLVSDTADSTGDIVHLTATTLGAYATDTLFSPGGSLSFSNLANFGGSPGLTLNLGSGADTIYAQPLATARVTINGNSSSIAPGDQLNLALAGVNNADITPGAAGSVTSSNRQMLNWTGMEQAIQPIDNIAPAVANMNFKLNVGMSPLPQSLEVQFSEDIGGAISVNYLSLFNATTNSTVLAANIAVAYNPSNRIATFTFPGYAGGVLPNGTYEAQLLPGVTDAFGNAMAASSNVHTFIFAAGTSGNDAFRVARASNFSDVQVFLNNQSTPAFVAGPSLAQIVLAGDDGDDSLVVDMINLNPTPAAGSIDFDAGSGTDSVKVAGPFARDGVSFFEDFIYPGATLITHRNVEAKFYDGRGGFDGLFVYGTTVTVTASQQLVVLGLAQGATVVMQPNLGGLLVARDLNMEPDCTLDLNDSDMIVDYTGASELSQVQSWINSARRDGEWDGFGITSDAARNANPAVRALGAMEATAYQSIYGSGATFDGEPIDNTVVLVKYTLYGDADFNETIDFDDYVRIDAGFNSGAGGWINGDFDGNGTIDFDDYVLIDAAFNSQ